MTHMDRETLVDLLTTAATIGRNDGQVKRALHRGDITEAIESAMRKQIAEAVAEPRMLEEEAKRAAFQKLTGQGLEFSDCVRYFAEANDDRAEAYIAGAREMACDGEMEIDDRTITSGSDDEGDYVLAWIWVTNAQAGIRDDESDEDADEKETT